MLTNGTISKRILWTLSIILAASQLHCGDETVDTATGDSGIVPGQFIGKLSSNGLSKLSSLTESLSVFGEGSSLSSLFSDDDTSLGLTNSSKVSDVFGITIPDTGIESLNSSIFSSLSSLGDSDGSYFDSMDTTKLLGGDAMTYDPTTVNDTDFSQQYYLEMIRWSAAISSLTTAQVDAGVPVVVAVLDTGVKSDHEDLSSVMWKDSSGNLVGYDAHQEKEVTPTDQNQHGTHVAGIIGSAGNNGKGVHGVGFVANSFGISKTEIMSVAVLNAQGSGNTRHMAKGIRWAVKKFNEQKTNQSERASQKLIMNMSLGGPFETEGYNYSRASDGTFKDEMFQHAHDNGALIIVAAGNESCKIGDSCDVYGKRYDKAFYYPCSYQHVLCVAASTHEEKLAGFSNRNASVGITAPGWAIRSTLPSDANYGNLNGTSMAAPVVAGAAAVLWSMYPGFTNEEIKLILQKSAAGISDISSQVLSGRGRLDLKAALDFAAALTTASKKPSELDATTSSDKITPTTAPDGTGADQESSKKAGATESRPSCGVVGQGAAAWLSWLLLFGLPLAILGRKGVRPHGV